ncbi:MAG: potassium channel protein [Desulfobacteraceae bacterium]|jgi:voltage-gated potassium channel
MRGIDSKNTNKKAYKIFKGFVILTLIVTAGSFGYMTIEGWEFFPSLYMTVITITTVGFGEIGSLSVTGRIFTIILIFLGMGIILYIVGLVTQVMVELQLSTIIGRKKLDQQIKKINDHYIVCGFGRIGKVICKELKSKKIPVLVIDNTPEAKELLDAESIPYIIDDATSEDVLLEAGIKKARGLISVVASDADNLFITLTARGLNHSAFIIARADEEKSEKKLMRAGADKVFLPYIIGGHKMAQSITKPAVTDFLEFTVHNRDMGLEMEELNVGKGSKLNGLKLMDSGIRQQMDIIIVAIRKKSGEMSFNPSSETRIESGDTLIALGKNEDLIKLGNILEGK